MAAAVGGDFERDAATAAQSSGRHSGRGGGAVADSGAGTQGQAHTGGSMDGGRLRGGDAVPGWTDAAAGSAPPLREAGGAGGDQRIFQHQLRPPPLLAELDDASAYSDGRGTFGEAGPGPGAAADRTAAGSDSNVFLRKSSASGRLPALSPIR